MLIIGLAGTELAPHEHGQVLAPGVVGAILFSRNFASREQVTALIASIRDIAGEDFLVCVDQEGGRVQRFRDGFTPLPPLAAIGAYYDRDPVEAVNRAEEHAWIMASEMRAIGVDFSFAPVADVGHGNRAIGNRAFHADPEIAAELVQAYVRGMHLGGMAAVLKHFPGHGFVREDTHEVAAVDARSKAEIFEGDLKPFIAGIEAHAEAVMAAHVTYTAIDDQPAIRTCGSRRSSAANSASAAACSATTSAWPRRAAPAASRRAPRPTSTQAAISCSPVSPTWFRRRSPRSRAAVRRRSNALLRCAVRSVRPGKASSTIPSASDSSRA